MGFHVLAKHGFNKHGLKDPNLVSFGGREKKTVRDEKGRGRKKKKRKRRRRASKAKLQKGMELLTWYGSLVLLVNGLPQT